MKLILTVALVLVQTSLLAQAVFSSPSYVASFTSVGSVTAANTLTNSMVAYWRMDDHTSWTDASGNGLTLTENGTITNKVGISTNAAAFNNDSSVFLSRADNPKFSPLGNSLTISAWVSIIDTNSQQVVIAKDTGSTGAGREWTMNWANNGCYFYFGLRTNSSTLIYAAVTNAIQQSRWHFVCARVDLTNDVVQFRYGTTNALNAWATTPLESWWAGTNTTTGLTLGRTGTTAFPMNGELDEVAMWDRALTDVEITNT